MRHANGVTAMKWCAWSLLAISAVFLALFMFGRSPNPERGPLEWPAYFIFILGSVAVWTWVTWGSESVRRSAFVLVVSFLYFLLALPFSVYALFGLGKSTRSLIRGDYPQWATQALIAILLFGWIVGALFAFRVM